MFLFWFWKSNKENEKRKEYGKKYAISNYRSWCKYFKIYHSDSSVFSMRSAKTKLRIPERIHNVNEAGSRTVNISKRNPALMFISRPEKTLSHDEESSKESFINNIVEYLKYFCQFSFRFTWSSVVLCSEYFGVENNW